MSFLDHAYGYVKSRTRRLLERTFDAMMRPRIAMTEMDTACARCGCHQAYLVNTPVKPDFDLSTLPADLREAFGDHKDAICANCGLYHAYMRFEPRHIDMINGIGKDALTTEEIYQSYPVPEDFIDSWYGRSLERQRRVWLPFISKMAVSPRRILVLRHWFGRQFPMLRDAFGASLYGLDVSPICVRHVADHYPYVRQLRGTINGALAGPFLDEGPFDLVIVQHILVHSVDVPESIARLRHLVRDGGLVLISAETKVAPTNPFHKFYPTEYQMTALLSAEFDEVHKLDENGTIDPSKLYRYTGRAIEFAGKIYPRAGKAP